MYKHIDLLSRADGVSHEAFLEAWRSEYAPAVRDVDDVVRYRRVEPTRPDDAEFDGLSEVYAATAADLRAVLGGAEGRGDDGAVPPADDALPVGERRTFRGEVTVQRDDVGGEVDGLYEHAAFLVRKAGMGHEAFVERWQEGHTPIARDIEGVLKYDTVVPENPEAAAFDGVAELYFADLEDLHAALGSEGDRDYDPTREQAQRAREDVDDFLAVDERPRLIGRVRTGVEG